MKWGQDFLFLLIQTLPTFWAPRKWILRICIFCIVWIPNFWIFRSPDLLIPRSQISKLPDFQVPRFPDAAAGATGGGAGRTLRSQPHPSLTPLPTHPGIKYVARSHCCDDILKYQNSPYSTWVAPTAHVLTIIALFSNSCLTSILVSAKEMPL